MECPKCHTKMVKGFVTITASAFRYLMTAFTKPYCLFYPADRAQKEKRVIEDGNNYKLAYHCEACKLFVIEDSVYNPDYPTPPGFIEVKDEEHEKGIGI